jgi:hypothetical protein
MERLKAAILSSEESGSLRFGDYPLSFVRKCYLLDSKKFAYSQKYDFVIPGVSLPRANQHLDSLANELQERPELSREKAFNLIGFEAVEKLASMWSGFGINAPTLSLLFADSQLAKKEIFTTVRLDVCVTDTNQIASQNRVSLAKASVPYGMIAIDVTYQFGIPLESYHMRAAKLAYLVSDTLLTELLA